MTATTATISMSIAARRPRLSASIRRAPRRRQRYATNWRWRIGSTRLPSGSIGSRRHAQNAGRRLGELENQGVLEVECRKGRA